jgi:uncharacterized membrane protein YraQ (UPF0718 family)
MSHILPIIEYIVESFLHIWPYLLITIPIAVAVQMTGAAKYINRAFTARPVIAILLATAVGAFSPLCACGVIPVVAAMLIGGVPLAPVMSFWLASPSMDPEIFFLTVGTLGWELAVWRLTSTLILSLCGGFITHFIVQRGWLGQNFLRKDQSTQSKTIPQLIKSGLGNMRQRLVELRSSSLGIVNPAPITLESAACCDPIDQPGVAFSAIAIHAESQQLPMIQTDTSSCDTACISTTCNAEKGFEEPFWQRLADETWSATTMVVKFMLLAWFVGALVKLYIPENWVAGILSDENPWSILTATLLGVPVYTSNLTAMPLVGGLLTLGMHPAAALAFLIAGPITTLPAMSAVWGLVNRKIFALYIAFALVGAVAVGVLYNIVLGF